jgi:3-deoxy-D-manno-octulosonic-acid transferase
MNFISIIYNLIFIPIARTVLFFLKFFNEKAGERERNWMESLSVLKDLPSSEKGIRIWFHSASMGEFEQAKPVIERIKERNPNVIIITSFFSPSGYLNQKDYQYADAVVYLPFDTKKNISQFIDLVQPKAVIFVRYEIWRNYLEELSKRKIPTLLICATIPGKISNKPLGLLSPFYQSTYNFFDEIYTVGKTHTEYFESLGINSKIFTHSDTRFDRIVQNVESAKASPVLPPELISENDFILVAGSTWEFDEKIIIDGLKIYSDSSKNIRLIFVPHEPTEQNLKRLQSQIPDSVLLSDIINEKNTSKKEIKSNHIIVDSIGKLLKLYSHADCAYIGGAFGAGVHSVTEPAGYGIPLAAGTGIDNSPDAVELCKLGALDIINNAEDFAKWLKELIESDEIRKRKSEIAKDYVYKSTGTSGIIAERILNAEF